MGLVLRFSSVVFTFAVVLIPVPYKIHVTLKRDVRNLPGGKWKQV